MDQKTHDWLEAIEARCAAATPGPWEVDGLTVFETKTGGMVYDVGDPSPRGSNHPKENMEFAAHARTDIPALLAGIRGLLAERTRNGLGINALTEKAHEIAKDHGWWDNPNAGDFATFIANVTGEVAEAWEEYRKGKDVAMDYMVDDKPEGIPSELADIIIRVLDYAGGMGIDLQAAIDQKMAYNDTRPYRHGGKRA